MTVNFKYGKTKTLLSQDPRLLTVLYHLLIDV